MHRVSLAIIGLSLAACGSERPGSDDGGSTGEEVGTTGSSGSDSSGSDASSSGSTSESSESESTETTDTMPEECPVEPALGSYAVLLDGHANAWHFTTEDVETIIWTHTCTVTSHAGTLAAGETIVLSCTDENAQPVEHTIELLAVVDGAPDQAPVALDQQVELSLWVGVDWYEFATVAWTLRDTDQDLLLLYFDGPFLPAPAEEFAPPPERLAPLVVDVNHEVCPWVGVGGDDGDTYFPPEEECHQRDTALRLDLGSGVVEVQSGSAGAIPGGGHAIVETSLDNDYSNCGPCVGYCSATNYAFTIVG